MKIGIQLKELCVAFLESRYTFVKLCGKYSCCYFKFFDRVPTVKKSRSSHREICSYWNVPKKFIEERWLYKAPNPFWQEQEQLLEVFYKKSFEPVTLLKKRLRHRYSLVNYAKFLRTRFYRKPPGNLRKFIFAGKFTFIQVTKIRSSGSLVFWEIVVMKIYGKFNRKHSRRRDSVELLSIEGS